MSGFLQEASNFGWFCMSNQVSRQVYLGTETNNNHTPKYGLLLVHILGSDYPVYIHISTHIIISYIKQSGPEPETNQRDSAAIWETCSSLVHDWCQIQFHLEHNSILIKKIKTSCQRHSMSFDLLVSKEVTYPIPPTSKVLTKQIPFQHTWHFLATSVTALARPFVCLRFKANLHWRGYFLTQRACLPKLGSEGRWWTYSILISSLKKEEMGRPQVLGMEHKAPTLTERKYFLQFLSYSGVWTFEH